VTTNRSPAASTRTLRGRSGKSSIFVRRPSAPYPAFRARIQRVDSHEVWLRTNRTIAGPPLKIRARTLGTSSSALHSCMSTRSPGSPPRAAPPQTAVTEPLWSDRSKPRCRKDLAARLRPRHSASPVQLLRIRGQTSVRFAARSGDLERLDDADP
jgi:hypothetical protein